MTTESAQPAIVRVAVDALADRPERTFTYAWPAELGSPEPGALVLVPYGRRLSLGYLLPGLDTTAGELRAVEAVVSPPMLTPDLLALAEEISAYYRAPIGTTLAAMLPPGLESRLVRRWRVDDPGGLPTGLRPVPGSSEPPRRAPVQRALLEALGDVERTLPELAEALGSEPASLLGPARRLEALGRAELGWRVVARDPLAHRREAQDLRPTLADEQRQAVAAIERLPPGGELLLEGVAASGKTDVYLAAIQATLEGGRSAVVLVPETSLVPQIADRVRAAVGDRLAVLHSGLSAGERHDEWWRILRGEASVVVGTRTASFAPFTNLGLLVLDEEHDGAYKSDRTPRYDARWVARRRATLLGARVVIGSATPDLISLARVRGGHSERAQLTERRVGGVPRVELVDLRSELAAGNRSIFSSSLADALAGLQRGAEQAVLLINRRGAATFVLCRDCGESLRCPECELPFVYHLDTGALRCHHCGRSAMPPDRCPACASPRIRYFGAGTQRVEAELRSRFPELRVARLDSDALAARRGFEAVYDEFREGRVDVLVGTQLAAKGLDLPAVTLAAVVAADVTLNLPDYRAAERTFQLLAQVAGRAGRGPTPGSVVVQTYAPGHYAVRSAAALDVDGFADEELLRRRLLGYPPFSVLARLLVADADRNRAEERGRAAAAAVTGRGIDVLGPLPSYVARRAGRYRYQVVIRAPDAATRAGALERVPAGVAIDVDPESLL